MTLTSSASVPDILEVISDLSNDEVFTPPKLANGVLDLLPQDIWSDMSLTFLDPGCKTGVFLREITRRLMDGLSSTIPDDNERLAHILQNMVWGVSVTELTSLMSRRTLYCSKDASSRHSVVRFPNASGNLWYEYVQHNFTRGRCSECSAPEDLEREGRDNYAYGFIHEQGRSLMERTMPMKFDVIVGNPPYQMDGGAGGNSASPLYNLFVEQAKALNPRFVAMIIPSRWMAGGRGLDDFRANMLGDKKIRNLVDFPNTKDVFPGVKIEGGVCYFLWDSQYSGNAQMTVVRGEEVLGPVERFLGEFDVLVRDSRSLEILRKVRALDEPTINGSISGNTPFGLATNFRAFHERESAKRGEIKLYANANNRRVEGFMEATAVTKNRHLIDVWKVLLPQAYGAGETVPHQILGRSIVAEPSSACTQTYLVFGDFDSRDQAENAQRYLNTRFARFLVSLRKISQDAPSSVYSWVPSQDWSIAWSDDLLYKKYGLDSEAQKYIASMVKEMPA